MKCLKCQYELFDKDVVVAATLDVERRANLAGAFVCPICKSTHVDKTGHDDFIKILPHRLKIDSLSRIPASFIFCTCRKCKYMMLFHAK